MIRIVLAAMAALALAACNPSVKFDAAKPWDTLRPWNHGWSEVKRLESGVEYIILKKGDGKGGFPSPADQVEVNYDGRLAAGNGGPFDSSYERGQTETFRLGGVIPGWRDGLQKMQPGDVFMFWIPSSEAYGRSGQPGQFPGDPRSIPPDSDLMFQVELINVIPAAASDDKAWAKVTPNWPTQSSDVNRRPSGLEYMVIKSGSTDTPTATDADDVMVHFQGRLETVDAEEGETPEDRKARSIVADTFETQMPQKFPVASLVPGWAEVIKQMRKGDHWMVRMPPQLLYGDEGDGRIPPGATVIYELSLEGIMPHQPDPAELVPATTPRPR